MDGKITWYVARSSGLVAWALLAAGVLWGLAISTRLTRTRPPRGWLLDLHRFLGALALVFTGVHLAALVVDSYVHFGLTDLLVPLASDWRPVAVGWGVVALYLLVAVEVTSLLMRRLPRRLWRAVHHTSLPLYAVATAHLATAGTDRTSPLLQWAALGVTALVLFLLLVRVLAARKAAPAARRGRPARPDAQRIEQKVDEKVG